MVLRSTTTWLGEGRYDWEFADATVADFKRRKTCSRQTTLTHFLERHIPANGRSNRRRSVSRSLVAIISLTRRASSIAPETPTA